jgi:hypothetical protein
LARFDLNRGRQPDRSSMREPLDMLGALSLSKRRADWRSCFSAAFLFAGSIFRKLSGMFIHKVRLSSTGITLFSCLRLFLLFIFPRICS